jgi:GNAT superfamily N-acetyltransferase
MSASAGNTAVPCGATLTLRAPVDLDPSTLDRMAHLFSAHYGVWGAGGPRPGERVRLSAERLRAEYLGDASCRAALALSPEGTLVGHLILRVFDFDGGSAAWISQLVVHRDWRSRRVASLLAGGALAALPSLRACGMATAHPHAVRAMERAVGARCDPAVTAALAAPFLAACGVRYAQAAAARVRVTAAPPCSVIDTRFHVDHAEADALRAAVPGWRLGDRLAGGEEYLALAVRQQR